MLLQPQTRPGRRLQVARRLEDEDSGGFVFAEADDAAKAAEAIGQKLDLEGHPFDRKVTLKSQKDGRLVVHDRAKTEDLNDGLPGWLEKKNKWVRVFDVKTDQTTMPTTTPASTTTSSAAWKRPPKEHAGWVTKKEKGWVRQPAGKSR